METLQRPDFQTHETHQLSIESCEAFVSDLRSSLKSTAEKMQKAEIELDASKWQANEIREENGKKVYLHPIAVAYKRAREAYVSEEESIELAKLADVLLASREYIRNQENSEKDKIIDFNHRLRELIVLIADTIPRAKIEDWLGIFMGSPVEAKKIVAGMGAEVAVYRAVVRKIGPEYVRLCTADEDKKGVDLVFSFNGITRKIDVKTGGNQGDGNGELHQVDIDQRWIEGFDVRPEYVQGVIEQIKNSAR